jgi:hypothetical protein
MMTYEDTRYISLNSQHGVSRATSGLYVKTYLSHIDWPAVGLLHEDPSILYNHVDIVNMQVPVSFYNVNYASNKLQYTINSGSILTLIVPIGNYSISSLKTEIKSQFLAAGFTFTIQFDESTNKYLFTNTLHDFSFLSLGSTILETIGFDSVNSYTSTNKTLLSEHCVSLLGIKKLKISSVALATSGFSSSGGGDLLGIIPVNAGPRQMISYVNSANRKSLLKNRVVDSIDLMITDESNTFVNLNNVEWSITLAITTTRIYKNTMSSISAPIFSNIKVVNEVPNDDEIPEVNEIPEADDIPFDRETDLDFYMYKHGINTG